MKNSRILRTNTIVEGVGINDADYCVTREAVVEGKRKIVWRCPFYVKWSGMMLRGYNEKFKTKYPTYKDCYVVPEWHSFTTFKRWMERKDWKGKELDKDLLFVGNKEYGPKTCIFITTAVNNFITEGAAQRGEWPIGVCFDKTLQKFVANCRSVETGKNQYLGAFNTPYAAHNAWKQFKLEQAEILAEMQTDFRVAQALIRRYQNYGN